MSNRGETMGPEVDAAFLAFDVDPSLENERELRRVLQASGCPWTLPRIVVGQVLPGQLV